MRKNLLNSIIKLFRPRVKDWYLSPKELERYITRVEMEKVPDKKGNLWGRGE